MTHLTLRTGNRPHAAVRLTRFVADLPRRFFALMLLSAERRALRELDRHRLDDLGITPEQARTEAARKFWDAPAHWRL